MLRIVQHFQGFGMCIIGVLIGVCWGRVFIGISVIGGL